MDAMKFLKIGKRICEYYKDCNDCPFIDSSTCAALPTSGISIDEIDTAIDAVENWDKEHQVKTYYSVYKDKFPNAESPWLTRDDKREDGSRFCPSFLFGKNAKLDSCVSMTCKECWNREIEE